MTNITEKFKDLYRPDCLLVIYRKEDAPARECYIERYGLDEVGMPLAGHPLTPLEARKLSRALLAGDRNGQELLTPAGLLPSNVLYLKHGTDPMAIWHTRAREQALLFREELRIPSGNANVPALLWAATPENLKIFALETDGRPVPATKLQLAPFFNIHEDGTVCMGDVNVNFSAGANLEDFMREWQNYFFGSYFSHMIAHESPVKVNIVDLWKDLVDTDKPFPVKKLKHSSFTLENLLP
jgi:PRTRC genetic system protein B